MTDRDCELDRLTVVDKVDRLIEDAIRLRWRMLHDQADHATPTRSVEPTSGGGPSDPTMTRAATPNPVLRAHERDINRCRSILGRIHDDLTRPSTKPDTVCVNCRYDAATHPRSDPKRCEACDRYLRRNGIERPRDLIDDAIERRRAADRDRRQQRRAG